MESQTPMLAVEAETTLPDSLLDEVSTVDVLVFLPQQIEPDGTPVFAGSATSVVQLLKEKGIASEMRPRRAGRFRDDRSFEWVAPTMFVSLAMYSQHPEVVAVALDVIASYLYDLFRGREKDTSVKLDIVCFRGFGFELRRIKFRGPVGGMKKLPESIRKALDPNE